MSSFSVQRCDRCQEATVWADTVNSHRLQVNAEPEPGGTYVLQPRPGGREPMAEPVPVAQQEGRTDLYRSHFITCRRDRPAFVRTRR